ncbi:Oidioi.mRNA.OKI2018_I69.chr1.g619.t1.cds [Oikopleura dioica]|uniref:Oidioi.mRNA.OKI2018_I69.chr1.g619.t1.cds n=1 Tax=Oikopleura dioica TaxID=34765 RepID=A0ABN7SP26_OIKDI|nr:Oidioi.mRNA.OKI2018_I69.chr1.g619.t1.cds [Oikopleura dioica]
MRLAFIFPGIIANAQEWSCNDQRETVSGKTCQRWDTNFPHRVDGSPSAPWHNLCCKGFGHGGHHWCYTTDPDTEWEYCIDDMNRGTTTRTKSCDCWEYSKKYDGKKQTTKSGRNCVKWADVENRIPLPSESWDHNFCRNPDFHHGGPWCYTNKYSARWEECGVDHCSNCKSPAAANNGDKEEIVNENVECGVVELEPGLNLMVGDHPIEKFTKDRPRSVRSIPVTATTESPRNTSYIRPNLIGGRQAMRRTLPWQVLIRGRNVCGGTLVSMKHVISAAHCFQNKDENFAWGVISAGNIFRVHNPMNPEPGRQERNFGKYIPHRSYDPKTNSNDICIIVTDRPFQYNEYVRPACLPEFKAERNAGCIISGFGSEEFGGRISDRLLMQVVEVRSRTYCKNQLHNGNQFDNSMLCAGGVAGVDTCGGDSGGPLVCHANGKYTLYGVVSFGYGCGNAIPGVYADAFALRKWIRANIQ